MNENASPQANEAQEQARAEKAFTARCFLEVFGSPQRRTEAQKRVLEYLAKGNDPEEDNAYLFDGKDGLGIIAAGIHRDGAQSLLRMITRQVRRAETITSVQQKPKSKVVR